MTASDQVRAELDRILANDLFAAADRRARLLRFLVEQSLSGHAGSLKESVIAVAVFDRTTDHDPKIDSLVRVEMGRLRSRLIEYYANAGKDDPVRIEIPKGTYAPVITPLGEAVVPEPPPLSPPAEPPSKPADPRWIALALAALAAATLAIWYFARTANPAAAPSVAVLPFLNLTGDPNNEYLSDGITDELTGVMAEARTLRVVARTSAFQFKGKSGDVREIGRTLNAGAILEGSLARQNDKLRIVAQLIRTSDGYHLWAHSYDFSPGDLQQTEGDVARATVRTLASDQPKLIGASLLMSTKSPEAHELYLRAMNAFLRGTYESILLSAKLCQQAIDKDPAYPAPYSLLASVENTLASFGALPQKAALEKALAHTEQALKLNPSFADAHTEHAWFRYVYSWDWPAAEAEFKQALSLGSTQAPNLYGWGLATRGRFDEAQGQLTHAVELDPVAAAPKINLSALWGLEEKLPKARLELQKVLELNPASIWAISGMTSLDLADKSCPAALADSAAMDKISPILPISILTRACVWGVCGRQPEARKLRDDLNAAAPPGLSYFGMAILDAELADYDSGFAHLNKAADQREAAMLSIKVHPGFRPFAQDPRYLALLKRLRLDQ